MSSPALPRPARATGPLEQGGTHGSASRSGDGRFWWTVAFLTGIQLLLRGWAAGGGWFFRDDFWWHDIVARNSLSEAAGLSLGGHYSPLTYIPYWIVTAAFPYEWTSRVIVMLLTLLGINAGVLAVARRIWPSRGPQLVVYVLWTLSSLVAPSWLWYSQFSMTGALLLTSTWTLWAYLRALSTGRWSHTVVAIAFLSVALFSQERMAVTAVLLGAFLLLVCRPSMLDLRWTEVRGLWVASVAVLFVWAIVYRSLPHDATVLPTLGDGLGIALGMIGVSAVPALLGGPWLIERGAVLATAATPPLLQGFSVLAILALIAWSIQRNRLAARAWLLLGAGIVLDSAAVTLARGGTYGAEAIGDWRYFSDLAVLAPLLVVAAFVVPGSRPNFGKRETQLLAVCLAAFGVSSMVTSVQLGTEWHRSSARPVVERILDELHSRESVALMDRVMPTSVVNEALLGQRFASRVLSMAVPQDAFDATSRDPLWITDDGRLVPGDLSDDRSSPMRGPCAYRVQGSVTTVVPLNGLSDPTDWGIRMDYFAERDVKIGVTDFRQTEVVNLPAGRHSQFVRLPGVGLEVGLFLMREQDSVCVESVTAGEAGAR